MEMDRQVPSEQQPNWRRRPRIVDPALQLKYSVIIALFGTIISLTFCTLLYLQSYETQKEAAELCGSDAAGHFEARGATITRYMVTATGMVSLFLIVFGIIVTHRVAGPLFVMNRYLKLLGEGRIPTTRPLRKKDELQEFYSNLLAVIEFVRRQATADARDLGTVLERLSPVASTGETREAIETVRRIRERNEQAIAVSERNELAIAVSERNEQAIAVK
jgi:hypothetical protein